MSRDSTLGFVGGLIVASMLIMAEASWWLPIAAIPAVVVTRILLERFVLVAEGGSNDG